MLVWIQHCLAVSYQRNTSALVESSAVGHRARETTGPRRRQSEWEEETHSDPPPRVPPACIGLLACCVRASCVLGVSVCQVSGGWFGFVV